MRAEETELMDDADAVRITTTTGLELLHAWMHPAKDGGERSVPRVLPADKPGDGREFEAGN
jgi:hypothetical protein